MQLSELKLGEYAFRWDAIAANPTQAEPVSIVIDSLTRGGSIILARTSNGYNYPLSDCFPTREAAFAGRAKQLVEHAQTVIKHAEIMRAKALPVPAVPESLADLVVGGCVYSGSGVTNLTQLAKAA